MKNVHITFQRGFTFLELLIVVAIVGIVSLSSISFYSRFFTQNAVSNTVDQLTSEMRKAQSYAMSGKQNGDWGVRYASNQIILFQGSSYATRNAAFDEKFTTNTSVAVSGLSDIIFSRMTGTPSASPTITVSGAGSTSTITVNAQGVVNR
jgi:prepilin-type N-terminal cleavage/methylation domain-containing protein